MLGQIDHGVERSLWAGKYGIQTAALSDTQMLGEIKEVGAGYTFFLERAQKLREA